MAFFGKYRGTVANNIDPLGLGRVQVRVPNVLGDSTLSWAMPNVPYAGSGVGFFMIPPVDANVWVEFEAGDPDYPIWAGCFWLNSSEVPASPQMAQLKVLKTDTATVTINDGLGPPELTIETNAGMTIAMTAQGIEIKNGAGATVTLQGPTVSINGGALEVL